MISFLIDTLVLRYIHGVFYRLNGCYRQRIEMAERVKREEEERLARRKRVEAIMLRTRGKNQSNTPTKVRL